MHSPKPAPAAQEQHQPHPLQAELRLSQVAGLLAEPVEKCGFDLRCGKTAEHVAFCQTLSGLVSFVKELAPD